MRWSLLFALLFAFASPAMADVKSCIALYQNGPKSLGGYVRASSKNYEKDTSGAGYSTTYGRTAVDRVTVFYYTKHQSRPSFEFIVSELMQATGLAIDIRLKSWAERGLTHYNPYESGQRFLTVEEVAKHPSPVSVQSRVNLKPPGFGAANDYVTVGVHNRCIVKLRYSTPGSRNAADRKFDRIRADLLQHFAG